MKIGILTFHHSNYNYGAVLQTFSIYKVVELLGYDSYIINYIPEIYSLRKKLAAVIVSILGFEFELFRRRNIPRILHKTTHLNQLNALNKFLDGFIVGSDQVWRYRKNIESMFIYYLNFVNDDKYKMAYAASFGLDYWEADENLTYKIKNLINRFNAISVREESGVEICKNIFEVSSITLLDPTLLLDRKYFYEISNSNKKIPNSQKYLAYLLFDDTKHNKLFLKKMATQINLKVVRLGGKKIWQKKGFYLFSSVGKWLRNIINAEFIVTDSFHCTAFSIIFQKQFICLANPHKGTTRLENLLKLLKLESRLYTDINQVDNNVILDQINYDKVEKLLEKEKSRSIDFLKENLASIRPA